MYKILEAVNPPALMKPHGYSHAYEVQGGKTFYIAGQVALDREGTLIGQGDLVVQFRQVCENLRAVVGARNGRLTDIVKLTVYVLSKAEYKARAREIGGVYREYFGHHYPAMTFLEVKGLYDDDRGCAIEIEAVAVLD
jgi:enamine deaminase RidA (YjgF/YER057c/UK114 family)